MNNYYCQQQFVVLVDENDQIIGQAEKWQAHKNKLLHRGFTLIMNYDQQTIFQYRRHPVFDKCYDMSFSSHQLISGDKIQSDKEAILMGLKREWNLEEVDLRSELKFISKINYQAHDPNSRYWEHEIDYIYQVELKKLPSVNPEYAYGFELQLQKPLAPWVEKILEINKA